MSIVVFKDKEYKSSPDWGEAHPNHNYWCDPDCIHITNYSDTAILDISDTRKHGKNFGAGKLISVDTYLYGTFEFTYVLPKGRHLWPAIWLTGANSWPPEIDIMEGWTSKNYPFNNSRDYRRLLLFNFIHPSTYKRDNNNNIISKSYGNLGTDCATYNCYQLIDRVNKCKLIWTPETIKIYYNDNIVTDIHDSSTVSYFRMPMVVVMNNAVTEKFNKKDYNDYKVNGRPFTILDFNYTEYQN